jgi:mRNA-degrading endonuclease RelE of RelBE toxin-antitoxin system
MKRYEVVITENAQQDLRDLSNTILFEYKSPITAIRYLRGIYDEFKWLQSNAESLKIQSNKSFAKFGFNIRRINYKKMSIIYSIVDNTVYIKRIIPAGTINSIK